jgi:hypothetical protein
MGGLTKDGDKIMNACLEQFLLTHYNDTFDFIATLQVFPFMFTHCPNKILAHYLFDLKFLITRSLIPNYIKLDLRTNVKKSLQCSERHIV